MLQTRGPEAARVHRDLASALRQARYINARPTHLPLPTRTPLYSPTHPRQIFRSLDLYHRAMLPQVQLLRCVASPTITRRLLSTLVASHTASHLHFALRKSVLPTHLPELSSSPLLNLNTPHTPIHALPSSYELFDGRAMISRPRVVSSSESFFTTLPEPEMYDGPAWTQHYHDSGDALLITQFTINGWSTRTTLCLDISTHLYETVPSKPIRSGRRA